jgi:hypothetical protein
MRRYPLLTHFALTFARQIRFLALIGLGAVLVSCNGGSSGSTPNTDPVRITFTGVGAQGIFDPSLAEDPDTGRLWMSFSEVGNSTNSLWGVGLRLAFSDDGLNWQDAGPIAPFADVTVGPLTTTSPGEPAIPAGSPGTWQNETSTLVYDPNASAGERWKLLWHQVLWANNSIYFASYSWISLKAAATPEGLAAATPVKLFGGYLLKPDGEVTGAPAFAPIAGPPQIALHTKHADLATCVFGEPGAMAMGEGLYLALDCQLLGATVEPYATLFRCAAPGCVMTDSASWSYVTRMLAPSDAQAIDPAYKGLSATAFAEQAGTVYLIATPVAAAGDRYDGCRVYRFSDLASGSLERSGGLLVTVAQLAGIPGTHHGACAYHTDLVYGLLYSQLVTADAPTMFQVYQSHVQLP